MYGMPLHSAIKGRQPCICPQTRPVHLLQTSASGCMETNSIGPRCTWLQWDNWWRRGGVCKVRLCVDTNLDSAVVVDCQTPQFLVCLCPSHRDHRDLPDVFAKWGPLSAIWPGSMGKMVWYCVMRRCKCNVCVKIKVLLSFSFIILSLFFIIVHRFISLLEPQIGWPFVSDLLSWVKLGVCGLLHLPSQEGQQLSFRERQAPRKSCGTWALKRTEAWREGLRDGSPGSCSVVYFGLLFQRFCASQPCARCQQANFQRGDVATDSYRMIRL